MIAKKFITCRSIACLEDGRDSSVLQNAAASLKYDRVVIDYENALSSRPLRILFACAFTVTWHEVGRSALGPIASISRRRDMSAFGANSENRHQNQRNR